MEKGNWVPGPGHTENGDGAGWVTDGKGGCNSGPGPNRKKIRNNHGRVSDGLA